MTASAFSTHGHFIRAITTMNLGIVGTFKWIKPLRSPMSIFLSHKGDLKNARRGKRNE